MQHIRNNWKILLIFILACCVRLAFIHNGAIGFWYDQARDAQVSQEIILNRDIKVQGPSASGSQDIFFHGVLYYYLIGPLYVISAGNPQFVSSVLALLGSGAVFLVYYAGKRIYSSKNTGLLAAVLVATSFLHVETSVWLSNPQMLVLTVPLFYFFLWKIYHDKAKTIDFVLVGLFCGLSIQAALYEVFMGFSVLLSYVWFALERRQLVLFKWQHFVAAGISFFMAISTMLLAEAQMIRRGILTLDALQHLSSGDMEVSEKIIKTFEMYQQFIGNVLAPGLPWLVVLLLSLPLLYGFGKSTKHHKAWISLYFLAPVFLLLILFKDSSHVLGGLEFLVYLVWSAGAASLAKQSRIAMFGIVTLVVLFAGVNLQQLAKDRAEGRHYFVIQKEAVLRDQQQLVQTMYQTANGREFTFSTSTTPFGINITWIYLITHYGTNVYHYTPAFVGPTQAGLPGAGVVPETKATNDLHFTILEPHTNLPDSIQKDFLDGQDRAAGVPDEEIMFGQLVLQVRDQTSTNSAQTQ